MRQAARLLCTLLSFREEQREGQRSSPSSLCPCGSRRSASAEWTEKPYVCVCLCTCFRVYLLPSVNNHELQRGARSCLGKLRELSCECLPNSLTFAVTRYSSHDTCHDSKSNKCSLLEPQQRYKIRNHNL